MTVVLVDTVGGSASNTYLLDTPAVAWAEAEADGAAFAALDAPTRAALLVRATRRLDATYSYEGARVSATQSLEWPRTGVIKPYGDEYLDTDIPQALKDAESALAAWMASQGSTSDAFAPADGLTSITVDVISLEYGSRKPDTAGDAFLDQRITPMLQRAGLISMSSDAQMRLVR